MEPEARIGFEIAIGAPCVLLIFLRAWVLSRFKRANFGNRVTNAALYITCLCVVATNGLNIWSSIKLIQYRNRRDIPREPQTGMPLDFLPTVLKITFALKFFYVVGIHAVKAAFLGIFVELGQHLQKWLRIFVHVVIWVTVVSFIVNFCLTILWCLPFERNWEIPTPQHPDRQLCSSLRSMVVVGFGTASNILIDLAIMAIPLFILKALPRLRRREMYAIGFVFLLGLVCVVAAIIRFIFLWRFIYDEASIPVKQLPSQQNIIVYTSELEVVIAVLAGCLPALRVLLRRPSRNGTTVGSTLHSGLNSMGHFPPSSGPAPAAAATSLAAKKANGPLPGLPLTTDERAFHTRSEKQYGTHHSTGRTRASTRTSTGNPTLAVGFGYGGYDPDVEERGTAPVGDRKFSIDSDYDGSEVELRGIPLSPLSPREAHVKVYGQYGQGGGEGRGFKMI